MIIRNLDYEIAVFDDFNEDVKNFLFEHIKGKVIIITDENVFKKYKSLVLDLIEDSEIIVVTPGEQSKDIAVVEEIYEKLLFYKLERNDTLIAFGGGVIGDLTGFIAATYMRGVNYIQIPTTLLSQVDSSVGGKVAINFKGVKNLVGAFYEPQAVVISLDFLNTLPANEVLSGLGEVIKYGYLASEEIISLLLEKETLTKAELKYLVISCLNIKIDYVKKDFTDNNLRQQLNFGHTFGHAIEKVEVISHGEAVMKGMMIIFNLYGCAKLQAVHGQLGQKYGFDLQYHGEWDELFVLLEADKKVNAKLLGLIVVSDYEKVEQKFIAIEDLKKKMRLYNNDL